LRALETVYEAYAQPRTADGLPRGFVFYYAALIYRVGYADEWRANYHTCLDAFLILHRVCYWFELSRNRAKRVIKR